MHQSKLRTPKRAALWRRCLSVVLALSLNLGPGVGAIALANDDAVEATPEQGGGTASVGRTASSVPSGDSEAPDADAESGEPAAGEGAEGSDAERPQEADALPTGAPKSAVTPSKISLPKAEGSVEGMGESFTPELSVGTGAFAVPLALPPGRNGVQPSLELGYSTGGGNGASGLGWSMAVPFIARQTDRGLPRYVETSDGLWHAEEDRFIFNGAQELVPVDDDAMSAIDGGAIPADLVGHQQYRARLEGAFMRFFRAPDGLRWVVQDREGNRFEYGMLPTGSGPGEMVVSSRSALVSEHPGGSGRVYQWYLTRYSDPHGSTIYYTYFEDEGQRYLEDVYYDSPASCASAPLRRECAEPVSRYGRRVHVVYEDRPDVFDNYTATWRITTAKRTARIEVTAYDSGVGERTLVRRYHLGYDPESFISLLDTLQLEGRPQAIGPAGVMVGDRTVLERDLGERVVGELFPAMRFRYSAPEATTDYVSGFGGLDGSVRESSASPPHSLSEAKSDLFDVNSDGLPDLIVTDPSRYTTGQGLPAVGVFFNGFLGSRGQVGQAAGFSDAISLAVPEGQTGALDLANPNLAPMDVDGDGRSDMLHLPRESQYGYFTPSRDMEGAAPDVSPAGQGWRWSRVEVALPDGVTDPRIDLSGDAAHIKTLDVNNDHLIDVVRTTGTTMQTWLNLGWLPGGDGRFGSAYYTGSRWVLSTEPIESCLLRLGGPVDFSDPEVRLADMNGDGIQDIVKVRQGRVVYWPGRGPGLWGEGSASCEGRDGEGRHVEMAGAPTEINVELDRIHLHDVNQDGAADILQVRFDEVDVWFNRAGRDFTDRVIIEDAPPAPANTPLVRLVDVDGSGTADILYGAADRWRWIDPMGGQKPRMLIGVENGLGGLTALEYGSSAQEYLRDLADAELCVDSSCERFTWSATGLGCDEKLPGCEYRSGGSPVVSTVVTAMETRDQFGRIDGQEEFVQRVEYRYHDAYYEGIEQEFRGFGTADMVDVGDAHHPTRITRTHFHQGRRPGEIASDRLAENPNEGLKGRPFLTELLDEEGVYLSSVHSGYTIRRLYEGLDGRGVSLTFVHRTDELRYDTGPFTPAFGMAVAIDADDAAPAFRRELATSGLQGVSVVETEGATIPIRGASYAHLLSTVDITDNLGFSVQSTAHGRVLGEFGETPDEAIVSVQQHAPQNPEAWIWRTVETYTTDSSGVPRYNHTLATFDSLGDQVLKQTFATLPGAPFLFEGNDPSETLVQGDQVVVSSTSYDAWGNATANCGGADLQGGIADCLRYARVEYDDLFDHFPVLEQVAADGVDGAYRYLDTAATWDGGLGVVVGEVDPAGYQTSITYDGLGRLTSMTPPATGDCGSTQPLTRIEYDLLPGTLPVTVVRTSTTQSCDGQTTLDAAAIIDGLGRTRVSLEQAESEADALVSDRWQRRDLVRFDTRGGIIETFQSDLVARDGSFSVARFLAHPDATIPSSHRVYDAFDRAVQSIAEDGSVARVAYHALSEDTFDSLDLDPSSPHYGTPITARKDGHDRQIDQVQRNRQPGRSGTEYYRLWTDYRADGQPVVVTRAETTSDAPRGAASVVAGPAGPHLTSRSFVYDSTGRRLASSDPDTDSRDPGKDARNRTWRYLFNRVDDLVAVRDPRGCGQNFYYDHSGRLVGEDYVSCGEAQGDEELPVQTLPDGSVGLDEIDDGSGVELDVRYHFDDLPAWASQANGFPDLGGYANTRGRATGIQDRAQRSVTAYDDRGNVVWLGRQVAVMPDEGVADAFLSDGNLLIDTTDTLPADFVAYDTANTYERSATFDHAGRTLAIALPPDPDSGLPPGSTPRLGGTLTYNARNLPYSVVLTSDGVPLQTIVESMDYTRDALVERVVFGDADLGTGRAPTVSESFFDRRRRTTRTLTTRAPTVSPDPTRPLNAVTTVVDQTLVWDRASNLVEVLDGRPGDEWPDGFRPISYRAGHDALYRVTDVEYDYTKDDGSKEPNDDFVDYRDGMQQVEANDPMATRPAPMLPAAPAGRPVSLTYEYDWLANMVDWGDDAQQFYERSIGRITNGSEQSGERPSALRIASDLPVRPPGSSLEPQGGRGGYLSVDYGEGGNVIAMTVRAQCSDTDFGGGQVCYDPGGDPATRLAQLDADCECASEQHYQFRWDELNRLVEARRYDHEGGAANWDLAARQRYRYDATNTRIVKQTLDVTPGAAVPERIALYALGDDFERRGLARQGVGTADATYVPADGRAESQYLIGGARVVIKQGISPSGTLQKDFRITYALSDELGSTTAVIDLASGALVECSNYYPNGARESYRAPDNAAVAAEPRGFTGKEADEEVGLVYAGQRYLIPRIGRWASPDPLHIHAVGGGEALNAYHYVDGNILQKRDPLGLEGGFWSGVFEGGSEEVSGLWNAVTNPVETAKAVGGAVKQAVTDPVGTAKAVGNAVVETGRATVHAVKTGDTHALGKVVGQVGTGLLISAATGGAGGAVAKGVSVLSKTAKAAKGANKLRKAAARGPKPKPKARAPKSQRNNAGCSGGACGVPGECFVAGTLVMTEDGLRPIEDVEVGDLLLSRAEDTGEVELKPVTEVIVTEDRQIIELVLADIGGEEETLGVTPNHPFWDRGRGWVPARELLPGDEVFTSKGGWVRVSGSTWLAAGQVTYNFEVDEHHTYFVGRTGAWVHNGGGKGPCPSASTARRAEQPRDAQGKWQKKTGDEDAPGGMAEADALARRGLEKNTERIPSDSGDAAYRIPDGMDETQRHITEIKDVDSLSMTSQLRDDVAHVTREGGSGSVTVVVDQRTKLSGPLQQAHADPASPITVVREQLR